ncbi:MAG: hypothetical protein AAFR38_13270 [Planctomycetota bacterium]
MGELLEFLREKYGDPMRGEELGNEIGNRASHGDPLVDELVRAMLQWEAQHAQARNAYDRILGTFVDYNELRAALGEQIVEALGPRYPRAQERAERLRLALTAIFEREDALSLAHLRDSPKREARAYVESLEALPPFAAARVVLLGLGGHAFPLDGRLVGALVKAGLIDKDDEPDAVSGRIERAVRAGEAREAYELLELWSADEAKGFKINAGGRKPPKRRAAKQASAE